MGRRSPRRALVLFMMCIAVIKWRTITAWFWLLLTIAGFEVEVRGTTRLLNLWPEGRSPLLFMLKAGSVEGAGRRKFGRTV